jgi:iron complex outermembrane recepter protein
LTYAINTCNSWQHELRANMQHVWQQNRTDMNRELVAPPPSYLLLGAAYNVTKKIKKHHIDLSLNVDNLANVRYQDYLDRFRFYADMPGRNVTLNIKYGFN